jgi:hypothetical protein
MKLHEDICHENNITQKRLRDKLSSVLDELNLYKKKVTDQEIHLDNMNSLIQMAGIDFNYDEEDDDEVDGDFGEESYLDSNSSSSDRHEDEWEDGEDDLPHVRDVAQRALGNSSSSSPRQGGTLIPFTPPLNSIRKFFQHVTDGEGEEEEDSHDGDEDIPPHKTPSSRQQQQPRLPPSSSLTKPSTPFSTNTLGPSNSSPTRQIPFTALVSLSPLQSRLDQIIALNETKYFLFKNSLQKVTLLISSLFTDSHTSLQQTQHTLDLLSSKYLQLFSENSKKATQLSSDEELKEYYQRLIKEYYEKEFHFQETIGDYRQKLELSSHEVTQLVVLESNSQLRYQEMEQMNGHLNLKYQRLVHEYEEVCGELEELMRVKGELEEELERRGEENLELMNERDLLEQRVVVMRSERDELVRQFIPGGSYERDEYGVEVLSVNRVSASRRY